MKLVSPDEILQAAKDQMLDCREPTTVEDWVQVMNFVAYNVSSGVEKEVCRLFVLMYDIPLSEKFVEEIAEFQVAKKSN